MSARSELDAARPVLAQMDVSRGPEKVKADLVGVWSAVEAALRSLVGGSMATGQTLIRDARSRQLLSFDQANALVAFLTVREQLDRPEYAPNDTDVNTARSAFLKLDAGLMSAPAAPAAPVAAPVAAAAPAPELETHRSRQPIWFVVIITALVAAGIAAVVVFRPRETANTFDAAVRAYQSGDKPTAAATFERAARENPNDPMPHVYLSRMAREVGNYTVANQELQLALKVAPQSLEARREYGSLFLAQGNYELARTFYVRALEVDPADKPSQGWLGCTLIRLNRVQEGMSWLNRAGTGAWTSCANPAAVAPGVTPP